jgi:hypothetical protein
MKCEDTDFRNEKNKKSGYKEAAFIFTKNFIADNLYPSFPALHFPEL